MNKTNIKTEVKRDRYPGIRSFETHEEHLFYGRDSETKALYEQVTVQDLVIVFAKSGIGKSSLINAGLIPRLLRDNYYPIRIRLQAQQRNDGTMVSPLDLLRQAISHYYKVGLWQEFRPKNQDLPSCLWEYLHACRFPNKIPVLIFDQFEEFFNHNEAECQEFVKQLSDVLNQYPPTAVTSYLANVEHPNEAQTALFNRPPLKVVLAIRSDRLFELNALSEYIPLILRNRFELQPLQEHNAREAIQKPAQRIGKMFLTNAFKYDDKFLTEVLSSLSEQGKKSIESFQLQIICQKIETQVAKYQESQASQLVDKSYIVQNDQETIDQAIQRILNDYYEDQLLRIQDEYIQDSDVPVILSNVRQFIEDKLIDTPSEDATNGRRTIYGGTPVISKNKAKNTAILDRLVEQRLIRKEILTDGRFYYEITHDTLVEPILKSRAKRKAVERKTAEEIARVQAEEAARKELARMEKEREEQAKELAEETRKRKRANFLSIIAIITSVISVIAFGVAIFLYWVATNALTEAERSEIAAKTSAKIADEKRALVQEKLCQIDWESVAQGLISAEQLIKAGNYVFILNKLESLDKLMVQIESNACDIATLTKSNKTNAELIQATKTKIQNFIAVCKQNM